MMEQIAICRSGSGTSLLNQPSRRFTAPVGEGSKRVRRLGEENYLLILFNTSDPVAFEVGDWCAYRGERFYLTSEPQPSIDEETGAYAYKLQFDAEEYLWGNKLLKLNPDSLPELSFRLTSSLRAHAETALRALTHHRLFHFAGDSTSAIPFSISIDESIAEDAQEGKLIEYANLSILDAFDLIAEAWECEWWRDGSVVRFGHCESGDNLLRLERGLNISDITPSGATDGVPNRLYPFGGTENIPPYYRKNLRLTVTESDPQTGRFRVEPSNIAFDMFNPDRIVRRKGYNACFIPIPDSRQWPLPDIGTESVVFNQTEEYKLWEGYGYAEDEADQRLEPGSYVVRLSRFRPNIIFERNGHAIAPTDSWLHFLCEVSFLCGGVRKTEKAESRLSSFTTAYAANPGWGDLSFILTEKTAVTVRISIRWGSSQESIRQPADKYTLRLQFPVIDSSGSEGKELWEYLPEGAVSIDCDDSPAIGPLTLRNLSREESSPATAATFPADLPTFPVIYNPDHSAAPDRPFQLLAAEKSSLPVAGEILTFAAPAEDLRRINIPASWFAPEEAAAVIDAITASRLRLPQTDSDGNPIPPYIDAFDGITDANAVEHAENFDSIFPRQAWRVEAAISRLVEQQEKDGGTTRHTVWYLSLTDFDYDASFRIAEDLRLKFTSGLLNGMTFSVGWHPEGAPDASSDNADLSSRPCFEIGVTTDYGPELPNATLCPKPGDSVTLLGWADDRIFDNIIAEAERELLERATDWMERRLTDGQTFDCHWLPISSLSTANEIPPIGRRVALIAPDLFPRGEFRTRLLGYEFPLDIPEDHPVITVGDILPKSRLDGIETALANAASPLRQTTSTLSSRALSGKIIVADLTNQADSIVFDPLGRIVGPLPSTSVRAYADGAEITAEISIPKSSAGLTFAIEGETLRVTSADLSMPELVEIPIRVRIPGLLDINLTEFDRTLIFTLRRQRGDSRLQLLVSPSAIHLPDDCETPVAAVLMLAADRSETLTESQLEAAGLAIEWASSDQPEFGPDLPPINPEMPDLPATSSLTVRLVRYHDDDETEVIDIETIPVVTDGKDGEDGTDGKDGEPGKDGKDGEDPYVVETYTLTGDKIKNGQGSTKLHARVIRSGEIIEDSSTAIKKYRYTWEKFDNEGNPVNWKSTGSQTRTGNPLTVTADEIDIRATFRCSVSEI